MVKMLILPQTVQSQGDPCQNTQTLSRRTRVRDTEICPEPQRPCRANAAPRENRREPPPRVSGNAAKRWRCGQCGTGQTRSRVETPDTNVVDSPATREARTAAPGRAAARHSRGRRPRGEARTIRLRWSRRGGTRPPSRRTPPLPVSAHSAWSARQAHRWGVG